MVALFVILTIILFLTIDWFVQKGQVRKAAALASASAATAYSPAPRPQAARLSPAAPLDLPAGVFVARGHTWLQLEPSGAARLGVDGLPSTILGQVDRIDVLETGTAVRRGDPIVTLNRGHRRLTLRAPVDGTITGVNRKAVDEPGRLMRDPFSAWLYALAPQGLSDALRSMTVAEEASAWMRREIQRLRDFLSVPALAPAPAGSTLHDGGEPVAGAAERLSDEQFHALAEAFFAGQR